MIKQGPPCCAGGVRGYGETDYGVVLVGIAAGRDEYTKTGRPFTGPSGRLLNNILDAVGWPRDKCYATNVCCGWNDHPDWTEIETCWPRFNAEMDELQPKLIITLGDVPCQTILRQSLSEIRGLPLLYNGTVVMPTYHPAAILREPANERIPALLVRDLQKIPNYINWVEHPPIDYIVARSTDEAQILLNGLQGLVSLDIETTNKPADEDETDIWTDRLICVGLYDGNTPFIIPAEFASDLAWPGNVSWLGHNACLFDRLGLRRYLGIDLIFDEDSMYQSYTTNEQTGIHRLETLSAEYTGAGQYKNETREYYRQHRTPPREANYKRCAYDVVHTRELHSILKQKQIDDNVRDVYEKLMIPGAKMAAEVQWEGMLIDQQAMGKLLVDWLPRKKRMETRLQEIVEEAGFVGQFNPGSPQQVARVLFDLMKYPVVKKSPKTQRPSADREVLDTFDTEFVDLVLDHRELTTAETRYITGIWDDIKDDKRIHPTPVLHSTRTGRWSFKNPPMHQIPQDKVKGHPIGLVRLLFVPDDEDHVLLESDYSQIEIWMGAAFSECPAMFHDLEHNYHSVIASTVLGASPSDPDWLDKRINAKKVTFGKMYREGIEKLAKKRVGIGCSRAEAQAFSARWDHHNKEFIEWQRKIDQQVLTTGELVTPFGRKRRFPIVLDHKQLRQAVNFPIQSTASDYTLCSALKLHELLPQFDSRILLLIHDSILMNVARKHLQAVMDLVRETMETRWIDWIPSIKVDMKVGNNWFEAHSPTERDLELVA